ncbi:hypothetical protein [Cohaesibacter celericrescens]|uniref:Flagellar protein FlgN n=1 Tax=Cohaesibacter celericrescens TaxID=2067669 RepID=A0A2N5XWV6_9HYPH|nr:hypothetical protein [Cohaesibacter celericrescens]PLW75508.1 hypothetical protein C0081_19405 [Cohaesibacter celericrescens]PLW78915.1 hypothetical protein C0081_01365 [Cohaesibacter celericrescens]
MTTELELSHFDVPTAVPPVEVLSNAAQPSDEKGTVIYLEEKMLASVDRAIDVVSNETRALRENVIVDLRPHADAKSRALLDLNRIMGDLSTKDVPQSVVNELRILRHILTDNEQLLSNHLEAVREITDLLSSTMMKEESDGTYTADHLEPR